MAFLEKVFALVTILSLANGRPQTSLPADKDTDANAKITLIEDKRDYQSNYEYKFETSNGITRAETGDFEPITFDTSYADVKGYYSYVAPDGIRYTVTYIADENGFQPKIHKSAPNQLPSAIAGGIVIDGVDDDRIGTKLLLTLGGGGFG